MKRRDASLAEVRAELVNAENANRSLQGRLPDLALAQAEREEQEGNDEKAIRVLVDWCLSEGQSSSRIFYKRAVSAISRAVSDEHARGLVVAKAYATTAISCWPENMDATYLLVDIENTMADEAEAKPWPNLRTAIGKFDEFALNVMGREAVNVEYAEIVEHQAIHQWQRGRFHLALLFVDRCIHLFALLVGKEGLKTYDAMVWKARILNSMGASEDALQLAQSVAGALTQSPNVGSSHPSTLESLSVIANVLRSLGRNQEALQATPNIEDES